MQDRSCQLPRSRAVPVPLLWRQDANLSFSWCMPNVAVCVPLSCHRAHPVISAHPAGGPRRKTGNVQTCLSALSANVYNAYIGQVVLTGCFAPPDRGAARDPGSGLGKRRETGRRMQVTEKVKHQAVEEILPREESAPGKSSPCARRGDPRSEA